MKILLALLGIFTVGSSMAQKPQENLYSLRVEVDNFRNSKGIAQFALYDKDGTIPDEKLKKYFKKKEGEIQGGRSFVIFGNIPRGRYAVTVLHDENSNEEIDKIQAILGKKGLENFVAADKNLHKTAKELAQAANDKKMDKIVNRTTEMIQRCFSCHAKYRVPLRDNPKWLER